MNSSGSDQEKACNSNKEQENGDVPLLREPSLKKARFAWQVKGMNHLKNVNNESSEPVKKHNEAEKPNLSCNDGASCSNLDDEIEDNINIFEILKNDFGSLDTVNDSENSQFKPSTSISESISNPRYVSPLKKKKNDDIFAKITNGPSYPLSMIMSPSYLENQCIARWQARQLSKGFIDNAVNRVIDSWSTGPMSSDGAVNRTAALDVAEFINNLPENKSVENEGIMMAISAHGLRNKQSSSSFSNRNIDTMNNTDDYCSANNHVSPLSTPSLTDDEDEQLFQDNHSSHLSFDNDIKTTVGNETKSVISNLSHDSRNSTLEMIDTTEEPTFNDMLGQVDFLYKAVSYTINDKGLISLGTDHG